MIVVGALAVPIAAFCIGTFLALATPMISAITALAGVSSIATGFYLSENNQVIAKDQASPKSLI